jgi:hypothetical protein
MSIAFTYKLKTSIKGFVYFIAGYNGLLIISNSQLISLLGSLILLLIFFTSYLSKDKIIKYLIDDSYSAVKTNIFSLLIISLLTAILASVLGSARWQMAGIDYALNSFGLIFTKYLPLILAITILTSAIVPIMMRIMKINDDKS